MCTVHFALHCEACLDTSRVLGATSSPRSLDAEMFYGNLERLEVRMTDSHNSETRADPGPRATPDPHSVHDMAALDPRNILRLGLLRTLIID